MKIMAQSYYSLQPGEQLCLTVREYLITRLPSLAILTLVYFGWWFSLTLWLRGAGWGLLVWSIGLIVIMLLGVRWWLIWRNDCCVVTNQRCLDIHKSGLWRISVREIPWHNVLDVQWAQLGLWANIWHYGSVTLLVKDAAPIILHHVYQPAAARDILSQYVSAIHQN